MGKAARWFRSLLGGGGGRKEQQQRRRDATAPPPEDRKRWSFARSSRDSAAGEGSVRGGNAAITRAAEAAWLKSVYGADRDQSRHAIAVAAATAAAADAAVAAAQAAVEVVRLTSQGPVFGGGAVLDPRGRAGAAVKIQTAFRGFLAKKALRALKALVKLQALVRGYLVRRQTAATLQSMQALVRAQAAVRAARCRAVPSLPPLHHHPPVRPRFSLQERYVADDTRSDHGSAAAYSSRRLSASVESSYDRSPKIVEMDTARPRSSSRASSLRTDAASLTGDDWCAALSVPASSPLLPPSCHLPARIAVPTSRHFPDDHDWCPPEKPRPATAQCTPRCAPPTPAKSVCGAGPPTCYPASPSCPGYMSSTQSSEAKQSRSQSAPKQRPLLEQHPAAGGAARKRVPLSEVVLEARASLSGVAVHKPCGGRTAQEDAFDFRAAVLSRLEQRASDAANTAERRRDRDAFLLRHYGGGDAKRAKAMRHYSSRRSALQSPLTGISFSLIPFLLSTVLAYQCNKCVGSREIPFPFFFPYYYFDHIVQYMPAAAPLLLPRTNSVSFRFRISVASMALAPAFQVLKRAWWGWAFDSARVWCW